MLYLSSTCLASFISFKCWLCFICLWKCWTTIARFPNCHDSGPSLSPGDRTSPRSWTGSAFSDFHLCLVGKKLPSVYFTGKFTQIQWFWKQAPVSFVLLKAHLCSILWAWLSWWLLLAWCLGSSATITGHFLDHLLPYNLVLLGPQLTLCRVPLSQ